VLISIYHKAIKKAQASKDTESVTKSMDVHDQKPQAQEAFNSVTSPRANSMPVTSPSENSMPVNYATDTNGTSHTNMLRKVTVVMEHILAHDGHFGKDPLEEITVKQSDGTTRIDISRMQFPWIPAPKNLQRIPVENWAKWIYETFVDANAPLCINLSNELRNKTFLSIQRHYSKDSPESEEKTQDKETNTEKKIENNMENDGTIANRTLFLIKNATESWMNMPMIEIFDESQIECWKLMVQDSFLHFTTSPEYVQYTQFTA